MLSIGMSRRSRHQYEGKNERCVEIELTAKIPWVVELLRPYEMMVANDALVDTITDGVACIDYPILRTDEWCHQLYAWNANGIGLVPNWWHARLVVRWSGTSRRTIVWKYQIGVLPFPSMKGDSDNNLLFWSIGSGIFLLKYCISSL